MTVMMVFPSLINTFTFFIHTLYMFFLLCANMHSITVVCSALIVISIIADHFLNPMETITDVKVHPVYDEFGQPTTDHLHIQRKKNNMYKISINEDVVAHINDSSPISRKQSFMLTGNHNQRGAIVTQHNIHFILGTRTMHLKNNKYTIIPMKGMIAGLYRYANNITLVDFGGYSTKIIKVLYNIRELFPIPDKDGIYKALVIHTNDNKLQAFNTRGEQIYSKDLYFDTDNVSLKRNTLTKKLIIYVYDEDYYIDEKIKVDDMLAFPLF